MNALLISALLLVSGASDLQVREVPHDSEDCVMLSVKCEVDEDVIITFQAIDSDGFEIDSVTLAGGPGTITTSHLMLKSEYAKVQEWKEK
jgi:hypothetical protein